MYSLANMSFYTLTLGDTAHVLWPTCPARDTRNFFTLLPFLRQTRLQGIREPDQDASFRQTQCWIVAEKWLQHRENQHRGGKESSRKRSRAKPCEVKIGRMLRSFILEPPPTPVTAATAFLRHARFRLRDDYLVKITIALMELTDEQIWWRPNASSNSIGNLILHLCGNARQWIVAGVGGALDLRERASEFANDIRISRAALLALLEQTLADVDLELAGLEQALLAVNGDEPLQRPCRPQGFPQTVLDAVFHVVEHFSYHTGQIILLAKWHSGERIHLYDDLRLNMGDKARR
jgi:uncharacterized damage-inducible protein DinB